MQPHRYVNFWDSWSITARERRRGIFILKVLPQDRRQQFRAARCVRQTFMDVGAFAAGRMKVYLLSEGGDGI